MKKHKINIIFCVAIFIIAIIKQLLVSKIPVIAFTLSTQEDALMVNMANNILKGMWLGPYNELILTKGVFFPLFLCVSKLLGITYISAQTLFYTIACLIFIYGIKDFVKSKKWLFIIFLILVFNPVSFANNTLLKVYRNGIVMPEILILFGSYIGLYLNRKNKKQSVIYAILAGLGISMFFHTKEDSIITIPCMILFSIILILLVVKENKKETLKKQKLLLLSYLLPGIILGFFTAIIMCLNFHFYGVFTYNELTNSAFTKCIKTIYSVKPEEEIEFVDVTRKNIEKIAEVSPTFNLVKKQLLENIVYDRNPNDDQIENGWFASDFRYYSARIGNWQTAKESRDFYNNITKEINQAFKEGKLEKRAVMASSLFMPWRDDYLEILLKTFNQSIKYIISYNEVYVSIEASDVLGQNDTFEKFKYITNDNIINSEDTDVQEKLKNVSEEQVNILNAIGKIYRYTGAVLFILAVIIYILFIIKMIIEIKKKKYETINIVLVLSILMISIVLSVLGVSYTDVSSKPVIGYEFFSAAYPLVLIFCFLAISKVSENVKENIIELKTNKKINKSDLIKIIILEIFIFLLICLALATKWAFEYFNVSSLDAILLQLSEPLDGTNEVIVAEGILNIAGYGIFIWSVLNMAYFAIMKFVKAKFKEKIKLTKIIKILLIIITILITCIYITKKSNLIEFLSQQLNASTIFEEKYVDPDTAKIIFPEEKRNLIYIVLESMELSFADKSNNGIMEENLIPEITTLMKDNINFSENSDSIGGIPAYSGTDWTIGSLVAQMSGLPLKLSNDILVEYGNFKSFLPGVTTLGDILEENGYNQMFICGSPISFSGRDKFFGQHGEYQILDYVSALESKRYVGKYENWGFVDKYVYQFAKEEITRLSKEDKPFNLTFLTADTHHPSGYICEDCTRNYKKQYENAISCASRKVLEFVEWVKQQDFYENTSIVIIGDHPSMSSDFNDVIPEEYERTTVNCFINSAINPINTRNRKFSTMDMFPSILASLGVRIEGERLGVGTNLFSDKPTFSEEFGKEEYKEELGKKSNFYTEEFLKTK